MRRAFHRSCGQAVDILSVEEAIEFYPDLVSGERIALRNEKIIGVFPLHSCPFVANVKYLTDTRVAFTEEEMIRATLAGEE